MTDIILRPATPADIPALSRLGIDSFVAKFGHMYTARDLETFLEEVHSPEALARELVDPTRLYRLALRDDDLLAYA